MKKNLKYNVKLGLRNDGVHEGEITFASCACPAGKGRICEIHVCTAGNLRYVPEGCMQTWNQLRKRKLDSQYL